MAKYAMAGHSCLEVADVGGVARDLTAYVVEIEPLGRELGWVEVTGLNDAAREFEAGLELPQEFAIYGFFDDTAVRGPDAVLAGIVGQVVHDILG